MIPSEAFSKSSYRIAVDGSDVRLLVNGVKDIGPALLRAVSAGPWR
jgi:hypothetical protein